MHKDKKTTAKKHKLDTQMIIVIILCVCIFLSSSYIAVRLFTTKSSIMHDESHQSTATSEKTTQSTTEPTPETKPIINNASAIEKETSAVNPDTGRIIINPKQKQWNLVVVNTTREMPDGYVPKLKEILNTGKFLDYRVAPHYEEMYNAAKADGIILTPYSAYRSFNLQKSNLENLTNEYMTRYGISKAEAYKKASTVILPPGTSEHNLGLAIDICNTYRSFESSQEYAWLAKHAADYGFILRYTAEKQNITGIVPEPWHWRYVGVKYAKAIKESGLCLEEYLESKGIRY